jgi:hypothetical protein
MEERFMKNMFLRVLTITLSIGICLFQSINAQANNENGNIILFFYPVNTEQSVGFIQGNEHEKIAPDAFFISDNRVFIDDTVNNRIIIYNGQNFEKSIPLSAEKDVTLMFYSSEDDVLKIVYRDRFNENGTYLYLTSTTVSSSEMVPVGQELSDSSRILLEYCFDNNGDLITEYLVDEEVDQKLTHINTELASITENDMTGFDNSEMEVMLSDTCSIYTAYNDIADKIVVSESIVINEKSDSVVYAIPEVHEDALGRGNVQVTDTNDVYQMVVNESGVYIYKLGQHITSSMADMIYLERDVYDGSESGIALYASYKDMDTSTIRTRMDTYKDLSWTFNSTKNSDLTVTGDSSKVTQPSWLTLYADGNNHNMTNVPYCWGGWNAESYISNINNGKFAGNINTSSSGYVSGTVGMDCSGYVSVAFDLPYKHGTSTLSNCFTKISNTSAVQAYDILNYSGNHVIIVVNTYEKNGVRYVDTYEESKGSGKIIYSTGRNYQTLLNNKYVPMRYNYLK